MCHIPDPLFAFFFWLGYCNSCLNPFIYVCTSREFKRAFRQILCGGVRQGRRPPPSLSCPSIVLSGDGGRRCRLFTPGAPGQTVARHDGTASV